MRNQGEINWCYAHTAADYLQYHFKIPEQISAADIAVEYNRRILPRLLRWFKGTDVPEAGIIRTALWDAMDLGYCPETYFPSEIWTKQNYVDRQPSSTVTKDLKDSIADLMVLWDLVNTDVVRESSDLPFTFVFPNVSREKFYEVLYNASRRSLLSDLRDAACEGVRKPYPSDIDGIAMRFRGSRMFRKINAQLDHGVPVTIDYFYGVLQNMNHFRYSLRDLHTSIIYGRRFDAQSGQCQYLVKDSYGSQCEGNYDPRIICEGGYLWVNEGPLSDALVAYEYFK